MDANISRFQSFSALFYLEQISNLQQRVNDYHVEI